MKDDECNLENIFRELRENIEPEAAGMLSMLEEIMREKGAFEPEVQEEVQKMLRQSEQFREELEHQREYYKKHPEEKVKILASCRKKNAIFLMPSQGKTKSKLGGTPDGLTVPVMACGSPMQLLAQIVCSELPDGHSLPKEGTLYFFCDPEPWLYDQNAFRIIYSAETPECMECGEEHSIDFRVGPCYELGYHLGIDAEEWMLSEHWLLGTLGWPEEETTKDNWLLLLRLGSDDDLGWLWSDCGILCFYIRQEDLAHGDFSKVRAEIHSG